MKVTDKTPDIEYQKVRFVELSKGDVFEDSGRLYIKTTDTNQSGFKSIYNSVDLHDGYLHFVEESTLVYLVNAELDYTKIRA